MNNINELMRKIVLKYRRSPTIDYFVGDLKYGPSWRIWIRSDFHFHSGGSVGPLSIHGSTIEEAIQRLLDFDKNPDICIEKGSECGRECYVKYNISSFD